jgi:ribonuclease D
VHRLTNEEIAGQSLGLLTVKKTSRLPFLKGHAYLGYSVPMELITTTEDLNRFCESLSGERFITVDTEFIRDKTYWPQLCLVQIAGTDEAACIDPLADGIDLTALHTLLDHPDILKVFHAARQDLEIFYNLTGRIPAPLFDTQVAAMVCGFGESVGYETLASKLANARLDKSQRFTDWSRRPLNNRQLDYAISDVTYLRTIFKKLELRLEKTNRAGWLQEEMATLTDPETYKMDPEQAWKRIKSRTSTPRFLARVQALAAWREREAQERNTPRHRVLKDDAILEVAAQSPSSSQELGRLRLISRSMAEGRIGTELLAAVAKANDVADDDCPTLPPRQETPPGLGPVVELLRVLLKMKCEEFGVAQKLVASSSDLEQIAAWDDADVHALRGWRREMFGAAALDLKNGRIALSVVPNTTLLEVVQVFDKAPSEADIAAVEQNLATAVAAEKAKTEADDENTAKRDVESADTSPETQKTDIAAPSSQEVPQQSAETENKEGDTAANTLPIVDANEPAPSPEAQDKDAASKEDAPASENAASENAASESSAEDNANMDTAIATPATPSEDDEQAAEEQPIAMAKDMAESSETPKEAGISEATATDTVKAEEQADTPPATSL